MIAALLRSGTAQQLRRFLPQPPMWSFQQHAPRPLRLNTVRDLPALTDPAPHIAIVTPSYNQRKYLEATVASVLGQKYPALSYHVQDGASRDGTVDFLNTCGGQVSWRSEPDKGQASAINAGFKIAAVDCDIMAYLNSDDTLLPGTLSYVAHVFQTRPDIDIVYGHQIFINQDGIGNWQGGLSTSRRRCSPVRWIRSARDNVLAPPRMGSDRTNRRKLSFCAGLGLHVAGATGRVQDGAASALPRMLPHSCRTKNIGNDRCRSGGDAASSPKISWTCSNAV